MAGGSRDQVVWYAAWEGTRWLEISENRGDLAYRRVLVLAGINWTRLSLEFWIERHRPCPDVATHIRCHHRSHRIHQRHPLTIDFSNVTWSIHPRKILIRNG